MEIVECVNDNKRSAEGSLLQWIDHTVTQFGKRMLRKWILSPLVDPEKINERLDAVEDLVNMPVDLAKFREKLGSLSDLERIMSKVFLYSVKNEFRIVSFDNSHFSKLKEFKTLLKELRTLHLVLQPLMSKKKEFKSQRLRYLLTYNTEDE